MPARSSLPRRCSPFPEAAPERPGAAMDFARSGPAWPHHDRSRFVEARGVRWHVQQWPRPGPACADLLLIHGTGASTHSFRTLAPLLARRHGVLALDLPGHGFSGAAPPEGGTLAGMARGARALARACGVEPRWLVGHSAGGAIAVQMALDDASGLHGVFGLNAALLPLPGWAGSFFSPLARLLALHPLVPRWVAWHGQSGALVRRLLQGTGSQLDEAGTALYRQLVADPEHVAGALAMMARWDLAGLQSRLPALAVPLHLLTGARDRTVPPTDAPRVQALVPGTAWTSLPGLGHLAHEEAPAAVAAWIDERMGEGEPARAAR